jgi:DUF4097 and DUF4098 domain-containing protein YvlB
MRPIVKIGAVALTLGLLGLTGCPLIEGQYDYTQDTTSTETMSLAGVEVVEFRLGSTDLEVVSDDVGEGVFMVYKKAKARDAEAARELLAKAEIVFKREGDRIVVERKSTRGMGSDFVSKGWVNVDVTATLPAGLDLDISSGSGDIETDERAGEMVIRTGSGDVRVDGSGGRLDMGTGSGDITVISARGSVRFSTGSGDVDAESLSGPVSGSTGSGDVTIERALDDLTLSTGSGDVEVEESRGAASINTSSGDITLSGHQGGCDIKASSGEVEIYIWPGTEDIDIGTSSGDVELVLYDTRSFTLDVETSSGRVESKIPIVLEKATRQELRGRYGRGDIEIEVTTTSGNVSITEGSI